MHEKIQPHHLDRLGIVYSRQSGRTQTRFNLESPLRQQALKARVLQIGWPETQVLVLEESQACSASSTHARHAFHQLCELIREHKVGGIFAVDVARWARDGVAWQWMLRDCAYENVLLGDEYRVYDPNDSHDHVTLGIQGVLAEYELRQIRDRTIECWWNKAHRHELFVAIPTGLVIADGNVTKHPDRRVRHSLERLFEKFNDCSSVLQLYHWCVKQNQRLPFVAFGSDTQQVEWRMPTYRRVLEILKNPSYAGAYVIGRTESAKVRDEDGEIVSRVRPLPRDQWKIVERDHFEGYISWQQYENNMAKIEKNTFGKEGPGTARKATALLSGLLRCMRCGNSLHVRYPRSGQPSYVCRGGERQREGGGRCLSFSSQNIEAMFSQAVMEVVRPAAIEASLQASQRIGNESRKDRQLLLDQLQQLEYEVERAQRQFDRVEPENRLVAGELERRWNQALESANVQRDRLRQFDEQNPVMSWDPSLAGWFNANRFEEVWWAATSRQRKRMVDILVREVMVDISEAGDTVLFWIHWQGGHHTSLSAPRARHRSGMQKTVKDVITLLRCLGDDSSIARTLNRHGIQLTKKNSGTTSWTAKLVRQFREKHSIAPHDPAEKQRRGLLTAEEAGRTLGISAMSIHRLVSAGILPAQQALPGLPQIIESHNLELAKVKNAVQRILSNLPRPLTDNPRQQKLF